MTEADSAQTRHLTLSTIALLAVWHTAHLVMIHATGAMRLSADTATALAVVRSYATVVAPFVALRLAGADRPRLVGVPAVLLLALYAVLDGYVYATKWSVDFALAIDSGRRFRINAYYQKGHMAAAMRAIPSAVPDADDLMLPKQVLGMADRSHGLLLVVGPTGSGKTTTLACLIDRINRSRLDRGAKERALRQKP